MTGLFVLAVAVIWLGICIWLSHVLGKRLVRNQEWYPLPSILIFTIIFPFPVADEFVGRRQFETLCQDLSISVDRAKAKGRSVYLAAAPGAVIEGTWARVYRKPWRFVDVTSGETILSYDTLRAEGGWLARTLRISEGGGPFTFSSTCPQPSINPSALLNELQIKQVERSTLR
jgi:hypothetical protein